MNPQLQAQANQSAAQGQQMLTDYNNKAGSYTGAYNNYSGQADAANQAVKNQAQYMQGEGSGGNQYHNELGSQLGKVGYDQNQMNDARTRLNQATGSQSAYNDFASTAMGRYGMNAGAWTAANQGATQELNGKIANNQGIVNNLLDAYTKAQTGANQFAGHQVQSEQNAMGGLQNVFANASSQRDQAAQMMNFYSKMAQDQGGLNATQAANYAQAQKGMAEAQQALAQVSLFNAQTRGQSLNNTQTQNAMDINAARAQQGAQANSDAQYQAMQGNAPRGREADPNTGVGGMINHISHGVHNMDSWLMQNNWLAR